MILSISRLQCLLLILACLFLATSCKELNIDGKQVSSEGQKKINLLRNLTLQSSTGSIDMTNLQNKISSLVSSRPRPYILVVYLYDPSNQDHLETLQQFQLAASQFKRDRHYLTRKIKDSIFKPIFFLEVPNKPADSLGSQYSQQIGLGNSKGLYLSTGEEILFNSPSDNKFYLRKYLWKFEGNEGIITALRLVDWVANKAEVTIKYEEPIGTFLRSLAATVVMLVILYFAYVKLFWIIKSPYFWLACFFVGYYVACSGYVWIKLNHPRWTGIKDEQTEYIFPSMGMQHELEGYIIGAVICLLPCLVGLFFYANSKIDNYILRRIVSLIIFGAVCYIFLELEDVIRKKREYKPYWEPPHWFKRGTIRSDQGHTI